MENSSNAIADGGYRTYWPMARAAHLDLHLVGSPRVNLLLIGTDAVVRAALHRLMPTLRGPIQTWTPHAPLPLPLPAHSGTLILHDVEHLSEVDQYRLLKWLDMSLGRVQVISTTTSLLQGHVESGLFDATLYYKLNVGCMDLTD
jgi:transcriptional regulator of acetoin/glycerol metabolism